MTATPSPEMLQLLTPLEQRAIKHGETTGTGCLCHLHEPDSICLAALRSKAVAFYTAQQAEARERAVLADNKKLRAAYADHNQQRLCAEAELQREREARQRAEGERDGVKIANRLLGKAVTGAETERDGRKGTMTDRAPLANSYYPAFESVLNSVREQVNRVLALKVVGPVPITLDPYNVRRILDAYDALQARLALVEQANKDATAIIGAEADARAQGEQRLREQLAETERQLAHLEDSGPVCAVCEQDLYERMAEGGIPTERTDQLVWVKAAWVQEQAENKTLRAQVQALTARLNPLNLSDEDLEITTAATLDEIEMESPRLVAKLRGARLWDAFRRHYGVVGALVQAKAEASGLPEKIGELQVEVERLTAQVQEISALRTQLTERDRQVGALREALAKHCDCVWRCPKCELVVSVRGEHGLNPLHCHIYSVRLPGENCTLLTDTAPAANAYEARIKAPLEAQIAELERQRDILSAVPHPDECDFPAVKSCSCVDERLKCAEEYLDNWEARIRAEEHERHEARIKELTDLLLHVRQHIRFADVRGKIDVAIREGK